MIFEFPPDPPHPPNPKVNVMPDILFVLASVSFFALMIVFMLACEKI